MRPTCTLLKVAPCDPLVAQADPTQLGVSTGWPSLDAMWKVVPGEVTIVTGG